MSGPAWLHNYPYVARLLDRGEEPLEGGENQEDAEALPVMHLPYSASSLFRHPRDPLPPLVYYDDSSTPLGALPMCETRRPESVCTCGRYRLVWE